MISDAYAFFGVVRNGYAKCSCHCSCLRGEAPLDEPGILQIPSCVDLRIFLQVREALKRFARPPLARALLFDIAKPVYEPLHYSA